MSAHDDSKEGAYPFTEKDDGCNNKMLETLRIIMLVAVGGAVGSVGKVLHCEMGDGCDLAVFVGMQK